MMRVDQTLKCKNKHISNVPLITVKINLLRVPPRLKHSSCQYFFTNRTSESP